jgi:hypothetical protein
MKKTTKAILNSCTFFGLFFVVAGGWMRGFDVNTFPAWFLTGSFFGAIAAPEFEPKVFNRPALWQMMFGGLGGLALAFILSLCQPKVKARLVYVE